VSYVAHDPKKEERDWIGVKPNESKFAEYVLPDGHKLKVSLAFEDHMVGLTLRVLTVWLDWR
jgi:hypothetical protein